MSERGGGGSQQGRGQGYGRWRGQGQWRGGWRGRGRPWRGGGNRRGNQANSHTGARLMPTSQVPSQPTLQQSTMYDVPSPYFGWKMYFPREVYADNSPVVKLVEAFMQYFSENRSLYNKEEIETRRSFFIDFQKISTRQSITSQVSEWESYFRQNSELCLSAMGLAMHQLLSSEEVSEEEPGITPDMPYLHSRVLHHEPVTPLKLLKANYYGKFVTVRGTVVRVSHIKPLCISLMFECTTCGATQLCNLPDGKYVLPKACSTSDCRGKTFSPKRGHEKSHTVDWQNIRVQEILGDDQRDSGRIPRTVDCELTNDLVDSCIPGDVVTLSGEVKVHSTTERAGRQKDKCMFVLYILANSASSNKGNKKSKEDKVNSTTNTSVSGDSMGVELSVKDLYAVEEIQADPDVMRLLVHSLCPAICGHELVKAALVLALMGGTQKFGNDPNRIPVRGDPHVLVVGDPGLGKSQLLQAVTSVAPRSVYVCGNTSTSSGLTVTLVREGGGDHALEAGALVLADHGCCCIDEFDKMTSQHQALLEAMEQQTISIAKAGIVCSLPARTSIVAAANPVGGHYNKAKTVSENLRLGSALLSRFDLVFILLDKPDEELDALLSEHVMAMHAKRKTGSGSIASSQTPSSVQSTPRTADPAYQQWQADKPLGERLRLARGENLDLLPHQLMRKYIAYSRRYVHPKLSPEASRVLQKFYIDLRKQHHSKDSTPITTRQLESLIRLTEARARVELRETCTAADAADVVDLMKHCLHDTLSDPGGFLDFQRSQLGSGMSSKSQAKRFITALQQVYENTYNSLFTVQEMRDIAQRAQVKVNNFEDFLATLNTQGFLLKKGPRVYQLQTAG